MKKQRAIVVGYVYNAGNEKDLHLAELNKLLDEGWLVASVHQLTPVAGAGGGNSTFITLASLVILEKRDGQ